MGLQALREGAGSGILKYALMSLLLLAVGGLAFTDVGGFFSDGVSTNDVAIVGDESISIVSFDQTLRRRLSGSQITPQMAYEIGYLEQILNTEIQAHLLKQAARDSGIKIGREEMAQKIGEMLPAISQPGESPSEALQRLLLSSGLSEQRFLKILERDQTAGYMNAAIATGFAKSSDALTQDLYAYENEERTVQLVSFPLKQFTDFEKPTEERLKNYYEASKNQFAIPETRDIKLIKLNTDKLKSTITIEDAQIREIYDNDIEAYTAPETRKIEQAIFATEDAAQEAYQKIKNGTSFKAATEKTALNSMKEGSYAKDEMMAGLGDAAFSHEGNGTLEPIKTSLGWSLLKINSTTPSKVKPYEEVKKSIESELIENELADQITLIADQLDDELAAGIQPEELDPELGLDITAHTGISKGENKELQNYGDTAQNIAASAFDLFEGESSSVFETKNGDIMAVNLYGVTPQSIKPFEEVKDEIYKKLLESNKKSANKATTQAFAEEIRAQETPDLNAFAKSKNQYLQTLKNVKRSGEMPKPLSVSAAQNIFKADIGDIVVISTEEGEAIIKVINSKLPDTSKAKAEDLEALAAQNQQAARQEAMSLFVNQEREKKGVKINKTRLRTAYATNETP